MRCRRWPFLLLVSMCWTPALAGGRRPARALDLVLRIGVARPIQHRYGQHYQALQQWLHHNGLPPMAVLAVSDSGWASELLTR